MTVETEDKDLIIETPDNGPVEIDIDAGKVVEASEHKEAEATAQPDPVISADEGIESLKKQLQNERDQRLRIEAEARAAEERVKKADVEIADSRFQVIANAIDAVEREGEAAERDYLAAFERGDAQAAVKAQRIMAQTEAKLLRLREGKEALEAQRNAPQPEVRQTAPPSDPVEALAANLSSASASWVRQHPECATDRRMNAKMIAAHHDALAEGIAVDTPEYFAHIENHLGLSRRQPATAQAEPPKQRESAPASAPVSRDAPHASGRSSNPMRVTLTAQEREICELNGWDLVQYAKDKMALAKAGKLGN